MKRDEVASLRVTLSEQERKECERADLGDIDDGRNDIRRYLLNGIQLLDSRIEVSLKLIDIGEGVSKENSDELRTRNQRVKDLMSLLWPAKYTSETRKQFEVFIIGGGKVDDEELKDAIEQHNAEVERTLDKYDRGLKVTEKMYFLRERCEGLKRRVSDQSEHKE